MSLMSRRKKAGLIATVFAGMIIIAFVATIVAVNNQSRSLMAAGIETGTEAQFEMTAYTIGE